MRGKIDHNRVVTLSIRNLTKIFKSGNGDITAVDNVSLDVDEGELCTLLGPSGCGKTTTLRCIAGFERPSGGKIYFRGEDYTAIPPFRRNIGMVFQSYALFPHLSIFENIAYGVKIRKLGRQEIERKVDQILEMVGLETFKRRKPSELSGGQQQRVALARALVYEPQLLLLDEPLSNLDAKLRIYMREEVRRIQLQAKVTTLYVTHDQEEALSISDRIAVMHAGKIEQIGTPDQIYENPCSVKVADFIGQANFLPCKMEPCRDGSCFLTFPTDEKILFKGASIRGEDFAHRKGILFIRPERMRIIPESGQPNTIQGTVKFIQYLGSVVRYTIEIFHSINPQEILVDQDRLVKGIREGDGVSLTFNGEDTRLFPSG